MPGFKKYKDSFRFLRAGIFDFSTNGIIDTFVKSEAIEDNNSLTLTNFFDTQLFITRKLSRLDLRYAAHLGIKTFVKTIIKQNGYFSVETSVSNSNKSNKKCINTVFEEDEVRLSDETDSLFVNGTHYEVVFPVNPSEPVNQLMIPIQRTSLLAENFPDIIKNTELPLDSVELPGELINELSRCRTKKEQIKGIKKVGNIILKGNENKNEIAINMGNESYDNNIIFKILAYLQLKVKNGFERIILINAQDSFMKSFCDLIMSFTENNKINIWSKNKAIILITQNLHAQIIWGEKKSEFDYINSELLKYYCFNFFNKKGGKNENNNTSDNIRLDDKIMQKAKSFIVPYDVLIKTNQNQTPFELFIYRLIQSKIINDKPEELGFLVNHENTYIGNKIIVRNYYEADMMFQNTFFTERFAYLIANNIEQKIRELNGNNPKVKKKIVLIGYKHYSELILKAIKRLLIKDEQVFLVIANIDKDSNDYSKNFIFDMEVNGDVIKDEILNNPESFYFASIVPIGSTLSTNDKIIAFFNYWYEQESKIIREKTIKESNKKGPNQENIPSRPITDKNEDDNSPCRFIYNHCILVVRDVLSTTASILEQEHNWIKQGINNYERVIITNYHNAKKVHYSIQLANIVKRDDEKYDNWIKRLNQDISFPQNWWKEKYVNYTENSSINSQNLMGFPEIDFLIDNKQEVVKHRKELNRLYELKDDILKGHLVVLNCHHKYYVDTEAFVRRNNIEFINWLKDLKEEEKIILNQDKLNILITPSAERESDLIFAVNNYLFDGNALIVYLDIKNWRNNIVHKLSFLKEFDKESIKFHYVDQALLTGETYKRTKSYLFSILGIEKAVNFSSIIVIVNRLTYSKNLEIKKDVDQKLFTFLNLYYPSSKIEEQDCELCKLIDYYEKKMTPRTVLDSCNGIINKNLNKLQKLHKEEIVKNSGKLSKRNFLRLVMTHELFYIIANIAQKKRDYEKICIDIISELNGIYSFLCHNAEPLEKVPESIKKINSWFKIDFPNEELNSFYNGRLITDKRISFLKVISSPPLSRYIVIRKYAHEKLLDELYNLIYCERGYTYDDIKILKSILKSLSFLKSNALVRKDVIVGIWKVLGSVVNNIDKEKNRVEDFINSIQIIKKGIVESFSSLVLNFNYNYEDLKLIDCFIDELQHDIKSMNKESIIQDFSSDVQFFIKNTIFDDEAKATFLGELLRQGKEITDFNNIQISNTILSLKNKKSDNDLFNSFKKNKILKREYINFLVWLFYDNTTIIRKTLDNFSKEIEKDDELKRMFYKRNDAVLNLCDIGDINDNIHNIKAILIDKVKNEYYYSSFKPYLDNADDIDFIEKLIYVTYAKNILDKINNKNKKEIETDTRTLLEVFAKIMGADAAFLTMKKEKPNLRVDKPFNFYVISHFGIDNDSKNVILPDNYYTKNVYFFEEKIKYPLIPKFKLSSNYLENTLLDMKSLGIYIISNQYNCQDNKLLFPSNNNTDIISSITFLYKSGNHYTDDEKRFRIFFQESGRLLLLLKNEIDKYVIGYLIKDKALELWENNFWSVTRFEKIYANSAHIFKSVYKEMDEFDGITDASVIKKLYNTWFFLTNETISYLYSDIEKNSKNSKHYLNLKKYYIESKHDTLGNTFNNNFLTTLSALLDDKDRWKDSYSLTDGSIIYNQIFINECNINQFNIGEDLKDVKIFCNKHILRTFIAQCLHNSLSPTSSHGHREDYEIKLINIKITAESITIEDTCLKESLSYEGKKQRTKEFEMKKRLIHDMICEEYSSTTLTSLQGLVNYMCDIGHNYSCNYGFNENDNFCVTINFN